MQFKSKKEEEEITQIRHRLWVVLNDMDEYFTQHGHELIITDVLSDATEDALYNRVSKGHQEGRCVDIRSRGLPLEFISSFEKHFENKYSEWASISATTGLPNLILWHGIGSMKHIHVGIKPYREK